MRGSNAPNGTVQMMLDTAMRAVASEGAEYLTMGLVPLSSGTWDPALYNFDGLEAFKAKLEPSSWEPIYAIAQEPRFSVGTLYAIADAFSDRSPASTVVRGMLKAVRQEWRWLRVRGTR